MFLVVRCILRSLFHLEVLLQEQTLAFLMSGVSMAGRLISLLGWILQINIVEMFLINFRYPLLSKFAVNLKH